MFNQALISKRDKKRFAKTRRRRTKEGCCQIYWITRIFRIFSTKGKQSVGFFGTSEVEISPYFNFDLLLLVLRDLGNDFWRHAWNRVLIPCDAIGCYDWISERECERLLLGKDWFSDRWGLSLVVLNSQFRLLSFWDEKCALHWNGMASLDWNGFIGMEWLHWNGMASSLGSLEWNELH